MYSEHKHKNISLEENPKTYKRQECSTNLYEIIFYSITASVIHPQLLGLPRIVKQGDNNNNMRHSLRINEWKCPQMGDGNKRKC